MPVWIREFRTYLGWWWWWWGGGGGEGDVEEIIPGMVCAA